MKFKVEIDEFTAQAMAKAYGMNKAGMGNALMTIIMDTLSNKLAWEVTKENVKVILDETP